MEKVIYPLQHKLFERIVARYRDRATAVAHYQKKYSFSRSKAYAHFNGERPIEGDFMLQLMSEYGFHDLDVWPEGWPENHFMVSVPSFQPNLDAYLRMLSSDLKRLGQKGEGHIYQTTGDLPVFLMKTRRRLAGFLLYYHFNYELLEPRYKNTKFGTAFMHDTQISAWLDGYRETLHNFHEIPGTDYWSPKMLDSVLVKLNFVRMLDDFKEPSEYRHLTDEIYALIHEMEQMVERGTKLSGAPLQVFNHQGLLHNNIMVGDSEDLKFLYLNYGLMDAHRYHHPNAVETYLAQIKRATITSHSLNSLKSRRDFFNALNDAVAKQLNGN